MQQFDNLTDGVDEKFDLVFMDIEGSEYFALKGMQNTLRRTENLVVEFISHHLKNVANVSVSEFVSIIEPYFQYLYVPKLEQYFQNAGFKKPAEQVSTFTCDFADRQYGADGADAGLAVGARGVQCL